MAEFYLLAVVLGLPFLTSAQAWLLVAAAGLASGCALFCVGARAWVEHRRQPERDDELPLMDVPQRYRGRHRRPPARPRLGVATVAELAQRASVESMRRLTQQWSGTGRRRTEQRKKAEHE